MINSLVVNQEPPEKAEVRNVIQTKVHELYKLIELPNGGRMANVCIINKIACCLKTKDDLQQYIKDVYLYLICKGFDVAILTLDKEVTTIKPVKLATDSCSQTVSINGYTTALATGWGQIGILDGKYNLEI